MWFGNTTVKEFLQPDGTMKKFGNKLWFTNLDIVKRHETIDLVEHYSPDKYPKYDNYDAIEVSRTLNIPDDYDGAMGVPISFLNNYNPDQFEILGLFTENRGEDFINGTPVYVDEKHKHSFCPVLNQKRLFPRVLIKRKDVTVWN